LLHGTPALAGIDPGKLEVQLMFRRSVVLIAAVAFCAVAADVTVIEEIAAKVNGEIVTRGDLEELAKEVQNEMRQQGATAAQISENLRETMNNALRDKIDELLLIQKGKDDNISVDADVTKDIARLQVREKISDPDKFAHWIQDQYGVSLEEYKQREKDKQMAQRVVSEEVESRIFVSEEDKKKYYEDHRDQFVRKEQVFLSQILISTEGKTPEQAAVAEQKAKDIVARGRKGEKFSDLVRDNSDDPETVRTGGSLPPYQRGMMEKSMEDVVFKEKKGVVTDPFKTPIGFVILRIDERYEAGQATFEEVRGEIQDRMARPKMEPKIREFLTLLRQEAFLEIKEGYTDSGQAPGKDTRWHDVAQLKPQTTTKEEVAARTRQHKRFMNLVPIPGTEKPILGSAPAAPAAAKPQAAPSTPPPAGTPPSPGIPPGDGPVKQ
jgi:peptidyl-prolyl cis-trans isomerase SurA